MTQSREIYFCAALLNATKYHRDSLLLFLFRVTKVPRWASRVRVQNMSSYTTGPPPRDRKIHPFFRRSIPGRPTLPPPSLFAPVRSTPVASSSFLRRTLTWQASSPSRTLAFGEKFRSSAAFCRGSATLVVKNHPLSPSSLTPPRIVHIREPPLSLLSVR